MRSAEAERLAPGSPEVLLARAMVRRGYGEFGKAINDLRTVTELESGNAEGWRQLARTYNLSGNVLAAQTAYEERNSSYWSLYADFGWFLYANGQYKRAEREFIAAADLAPDQPAVWGDLGGLYLATGRLKEVEGTLKRALELEPSSGVASNLGTVYFNLGKYEKAARFYRQACSLNSNDYRLWGNLGDALRQSGRRTEANAAYGRAIALAEMLLKISPNDVHLLSYLSMGYAKQEQFVETRSYETRTRELASRVQAFCCSRQWSKNCWANVKQHSKRSGGRFRPDHRSRR